MQNVLRKTTRPFAVFTYEYTVIEFTAEAFLTKPRPRKFTGSGSDCASAEKTVPSPQKTLARQNLNSSSDIIGSSEVISA